VHPSHHRSLGPNAEELLEIAGLSGDLTPSHLTTQQIGKIARAFETWEFRTEIDDRTTIITE